MTDASTHLGSRRGSPSILSTLFLILCAGFFLGADDPAKTELTGDWRGRRTTLENRGVVVSLYYNHFLGIRASGGEDSGSSQKQSGTLDVFLRADFETMNLIRGGEALMQVKSGYGENINPQVGAIADPIDDADFDEPLYIDQLWYQQSTPERKLRLRGGYLDYQTIIDRNAYANVEDRQFFNAALDNNLLVPLKIGLGAALFLEPKRGRRLVLGTADADNEIRSAGIDTAFDGLDSLMLYAEVSIDNHRRGDDSLSGTYRLGTFYDPRVKTVFGPVPPADPETDRGDVGFYANFDQVVAGGGRDDVPAVSLFARYGYRDQEINPVEHFWSLGLECSGLSAASHAGTFGAAFYASHSSRDFRRYVDSDFDRESGVEVYYSMQLRPWLTVTPDVQFIHNPGGQSTARDALVLALRGRLTF